MSRRLLVTGGAQRDAAIWFDEFHHYERAMLAEVDLDTGHVKVLLEHETPPAWCAEDRPSIVFKCATLQGDRLYLCTQTEVLILRWPSLETLEHLSLPSFNDLHHVLPVGEDLLVVSTGLDMVLELDAARELRASHAVIDEAPWARFDRAVDYRRIASTKPHKAHPNFVFLWEGAPWVTRCHQRDAVKVGEITRRIAVDVERIHDGNVVGEEVHFTAVDGHVVFTRPHRPEARRVWNLASMTQTDQPLGWCRGLHVEGDLAYVGFSRIRPTKLHDNLRWIKNLGKPRGYLPTRIGVYDLAQKRHVRDIDLESVGLAAVFSILPAP